LPFFAFLFPFFFEWEKKVWAGSRLGGKKRKREKREEEAEMGIEKKTSRLGD